jgi:hypothetical protein
MVRSSYADWYRAAYPFAQEHRALGGLKLLDVPERALGHFEEPAVPQVSFQLSLRCRPGEANVRFAGDRMRVALEVPTFIVAPAGQKGSYDIPSSIHLRVIEFGTGAFQGLVRRRMV